MDLDRELVTSLRARPDYPRIALRAGLLGAFGGALTVVFLAFVLPWPPLAPKETLRQVLYSGLGAAAAWVALAATIRYRSTVRCALAGVIRTYP